MKITLQKTVLLSCITLLTIIFFSACKKDQLNIDQEKVFLQADFKIDSGFPYNAGWQVTLKPDGKASLIPGGDIIWTGTYKIKGKKLTISTDGDTKFEFEIISESEIREKEYGVLLRLK